MTATPAGMTYADYLKLDRLLGAQQPLSGLHDEMLFIVIHQAKELWLKQLLHEVDLAVRLIGEDRFAPACKALSRVSRIESVMTLSWEVLSTLTPVDYLAFREVLGTSSGFQSAQFRALEYRLGIKDERYLKHHAEGSDEHRQLVRALEEPSLREASHAALERAGLDVGDRSDEAIAGAWLEIYRDSEGWFELYQLAEKLLDIDDALAGWRHKHVLTVERIIGNRPGTGGSAGAPYLRSTLDKRAFPELWALRTQL
ncbi:MAG TPA: tryptophan 2,3-dioxygenase [Sphingomicrobium sp.]|nr:tryptophan 2,3-dioxygenase [Sphingomicrobium sp.]